MLAHPLEMLFLTTSLCQLAILLVHDWLDLFPLNDIAHLQHSMSARQRLLMIFGNTAVYFGLLLAQAIYFGQTKPFWLGIAGAFYYCSVWFMMYQQWYKLYLFGAPEQVCRKYALEYGRTLQILPPRGNNPRPNLLHAILHVLFLVNSVLTILFGFNLIGA
jgi:hypothetical protein